jgi:hypothetical protein
MVNARRITVGLAALALLVGSGVASAGQADAGLDRQLRGLKGKFDARERGRSPREGKVTTVAPPAATAAAPERPAAPSAPSTPSSSGSSASSAAPAEAAPTVAAAPVLSKDAPSTAPAVGVIGKGASSGPSPAATPEPSTLLLMGAGLAGLYRLRRKR